MPEPGEVRLFGKDLLSMEFLYVPGGGAEEKAFWIAGRDVNRRQYADFLKGNPEWRRGAVLPAMTEADYLRDWERDEPQYARYHDPVVYVSFLAAEAFCRWAGVRLPKPEEWVRAVATLPDGKGMQRLLIGERKVGNWTSGIGRGNRRLIVGVEADPDGYKPTSVSELWGFRCAVDAQP